MADAKRQTSRNRGTAQLGNLPRKESDSKQFVTWYVINKNEANKAKLPTEICQWLEDAYIDGKSVTFFHCEKTGSMYKAFLGKDNKLSVDKNPYAQLERVEERQIVQLPADAQLPHTPDKNETNPNTTVLESSVQTSHSTADADSVDDLTNKLGDMTLKDVTSKMESDPARASSIVKLNKNDNPARNQRQCNQAQSSLTSSSKHSEKPTNSPVNPESKTVSNTPSVVQDQGCSPQNNGNSLTPKLDADKGICTGPKAVDSSPDIPVGNISNLGASPKKTEQSSSTNFPLCSKTADAPATAESTTHSITPTGVLNQSSGPQSERRKLPQIPEPQPKGSNAVTVSSPVTPVGNTSFSFSNHGARPKETKPLEAGKEQRGHKAMSTEELWQKIPAWNKEDVMICFGKTTCVLFPSNDVDLDESYFFQSLFLDHSWSKCFLEYLQKKQFSIKKENVRISGKLVQHIIISGKIEHTNVDKYQMLYQLVQECGIRATLLKKNSSECEHILQESSALVAEHPMSIYRNIQGDKLVLIGHEQNLKEIMKVYGLESIEGKGYLFGESVEVSSHDAFLFTKLNLSKFLQFDKCKVKCHVTKGIQNPTLIFVGMSLKQIREASESTTRFLEKVPCDKLVLPNVKFNLCKQIEAKHYVEERLKQKGINCVIFVDDEAVQLFSVTENQIKLAKSEIESCINTHMLPTNIYKTLLEQNLNGGKLNIISDKENICSVVCTFDISEHILEITRSSTTHFVCSSVSKIEWDFICKHYAETLNRIKENYGVKITTMNNGLQVEGESGFNTEELEKEIRQLLPKRKENILVDSSLEDFVLSEEGRECLKQLAVDNKTMCDIHVGDDGAKDACDNLLCSWYFENVSQQILLVQGRAADLHVDCLVIPVNERMVPLTCAEHGIQEAFDEEMRKEVTDKSAKLGQLIECSVWIEGEHKGKLKCNKLPVYLTVRNRNRLITNQELHDKLKEIFTKAESLKLESVGLPVEGISENKFTVMLRAVVEAASVFFKHGNGQNLKKVYLCTMKKDDADLKINEVEKTLEETKTSTSTSRIRKGIKSLLRFPNDEIKTKVMFGSLHETKADVLVNTVTKYLDLGKGAVSKQIMKLAGKGIQDELKRKYPNGIKSLEIALTEPHELVGFKKVFHVAVDELEPNIIEKIKILKVLTCKCLELADELKMSSIAFPALGTGGRDYPFRDVAWAMFEAVSDFQRMGQKHLKKVKFVLFKTDNKTIQAFSNEDNRRKEKRDSSRTRIEVGKVPELLIGRINNQKRPEFKIVIESEYPVPSFAVEVFVKVQKGPKVSEIPRCSISYADVIKGDWNDSYLIETTDETDMFKKGIETCLSQSTTERVTHLLFHMCQESSMSAYSQVQCITDVIIQGGQRYLQSVTICVPSQSEFENIKWRIQENKNSKTLFQGFISIVGLDSPQIVWTSSYLPVMPSGMTIVLSSNTEDNLQGAKEAIIKTLKMQMAFKPLEIDSVFEKGTAQLNTAIVKDLKENGLLNEWMKNIKEQHDFQAEENANDVKITGQAVKLFSKEWILKSLDTSCIKIEMDEDEYILLCETEFFSKYLNSRIYSRPVMKITCKREKCNEIHKAFDEHLHSLRTKGKNEIKLGNIVEISKVQECVRSLDVDCIVRTGDESGIVVVMWTTYEEYMKQKNRLLTALGLRDTTKDSRKMRQYRTAEAVSVTDKETYALDKTNLQMDSKLGAAFETAEGLIVRVYKGDITRLTVDCIVNAANDHLANAAGVAKAIEDAAGAEFIQECQSSVHIYGPLKVGEARACTGGDLQCKVIINAVGPRWSTYRDKEECLALLRDTVRNCLELSNCRNHETIALPSISAGIFGVPLDLCAEQYCQAIISFSKKTSRDLVYLKEVHFVDIKQDTLDVIHSTFSKWLKSSSGTPLFQVTPFSSDKETSTNSRHFLSLGNVSTGQHQQLMHQQPATLYDTVKIIQHNTKQLGVKEYLSSSLQFTAGGDLKNSLHQEGAEKHQAEMTPSGSSMKLKGLPAQVAGGDLNKNLHQEGAEKQHQAEMTPSGSSMKLKGLPAQVAGGDLNKNLHQEGAEKQHQAEMTPSGSSMKLKGLPAQVAGGDLNKNLHQEGAEKQYTTNQTEMTQSTRSTKQMGTVSFKTISPNFEVFIASDRKLNIYVVHADITAMSVDAMVSTEDKYLSGKGAIARSVRNVADDVFAKTLEQLRSGSSLRLCDVVITSVRGMPCKFVLHAVSPHWDKDAVKHNKHFESDVSLTIFNILKKAEEKKLESVAVPFLGTSDDEDKRPTPVDTCARAMIKGLMDYIQSKPSSSIAHVLFVSSDMVILQWITDALHHKSREMATSELVNGKIIPCQPTVEIMHL